MSLQETGLGLVVENWQPERGLGKGAGAQGSGAS